MKEILITSSVLIVALLLLRLLFGKKVRRKLIYAAWALVALRLLIPVQIGQLDFSVLTAAQDVTQSIEQVATRPVSGPSKQEVYQDIVTDYLEKDQTVFVPQVQEQIREEMSQGTTNPADIADKIQQKYPQQEVFVPQVQEQVQQQVDQAQTGPTLGQVAKVVWLAGVAVMAVWFAIVNLRYGLLLRRNREPLACESPIPVYVSEKVASPCLVGLFRPAVHLTPKSAASEETRRHVLTHELTHYRHGDHIWSLVRCVCLCVYWFDPLVWVAAYMSRRDCELACDEGALQQLGEADRIAYGRTLLEVVSHAARHANLLQTATAMNETKKQLKERVNFIVKKRKISITAAICMVLICAIVAGCVAAGPTNGQQNLGTNPLASTPSSTTAPGTTQPQPDAENVKTLVSHMYCSRIMVKDLSVASQFESELDLTVTEFADSSVSLELELILADDFWFDFAHSGNSFMVQHEELGLPYYCAKAYIYQPGLEGYMPYDFAVDVEKGYMIFKESSNIMSYYVVASSNPEVDPLQIAEYFSAFFQIYDYTGIDTGKITDLYYDLYGTWISENGEILGKMPFYIAGKLPEAYEDGDTVEMELNFIWPDGSGYRNEGAMTCTGTVNIFVDHHGHPNFHGTGTLYDLDTNEQIGFVYNIFPMDSTVIICVNGQYLIGNLRETSQVTSQLNYYKEFIFTDPKPTEPIDEELTAFNALFGDIDSWYNMALSTEYVTPEQINLQELFLNGFPGEFTDEERAELDEQIAELEEQFGGELPTYSTKRLPADQMNQVLTDLFGITLEDVDTKGSLGYLEKTNCYYIIGGGAGGVMNFNALSVEHLEDGTIRLTYTQDCWRGDATLYVVTLMPHGDSYWILSNRVQSASVLYLADLPEEAQIMIVGEDRYNSSDYHDYSLRAKVYGAFDGVYAFRRSTWNMAEIRYYDIVYGYVFEYYNEEKIRIYTEAGNYSLEEALDGGIISVEQLKEVFENYCAAYPGRGWIEETDYPATA